MSTGCLLASGLLADARGEPLRPGGAALSEALIEAAGFAPGGRVLDIGCGRGGSLARLARRGFRAVGLDRSAPALAAARQAEAPLVLADGGRLPFADAALDGVLAECTLSVMPDRARALAEWRRVLRLHGRLGLSDVYFRAPAEPRQAGIADRPALLAALAAAGFGVELWQDRSDVLAAFAARFVFRYGPLAALWDDAGGVAARPGYFLLTATRQEGLP
jgi:ubiquinone/menaquinone biosynthesis C-methylase UbiE